MVDVSGSRPNSHLAVRFALLMTAAGILILAALGVYFDSFLKQNFLENTETRMRHGFQRLAYNISNIESGLHEGIAFIKSHEPTLASIDLVNNYEDKNNYNTFLIDEEKKTIAEELLSRVKLSFNNDISLYNRAGELIAYVAKDEGGYHLNFISYADNRRRLLRRYESEQEYQSVPLELLRQDQIELMHQPNYTTNRLRQSSVVTYSYMDETLVMKSHASLFDSAEQREVAHIEMTRVLDAAYFTRLSQDLDVNFELTIASVADANLIRSLFDGDALNRLQVDEAELEYRGTLHLVGLEGLINITAHLERAALTRVLAENRTHLFYILLLVAGVTLVLMRFMIQRSLERPLSQLMQQIGRIARQDYKEAEVVSSGDELQTISESINRLAQTVREREDSLEASRQELEYLSNHDVLTELPNRRFWGQKLDTMLQDAAAGHREMAMLFIDLDQFKQVNDTQGHDVGDALLLEVAARLRANVAPHHTLARIGGDEFNILVERVSSAAELEEVARHYLEQFTRPFCVAGQEINISASIGVAIYPLDGHDSVTLIKSADLAMYKAKESGRNKYCFFSDDLSTRMKARTEMTRALREAIQHGDQFRLFYQPKVSATTGAVVSMEALIRWQSPVLGFVSPADFIPLAEELGLINPIGEWVLDQACHDFMRLMAAGVSLNHVSVNVSNVQLSNDSLSTHLLRTMKSTGICPEQLELEITESYIATDIEEAVRTLRKFRQMGIGLAIDDFGTGYSAMSYLQTLPVTRLKIDKSFVDGLPNDKNSVAIARAIISLAQSFDLALTAEGVETDHQLSFLVGEGCHEIQGYYYSKPLPFEELVSYCRASSADNVVRLCPENA